MKTRTKKIWTIIVCAVALLGWGVLHLANNSRRLASEGVETGAVLTSSFTRRVQHGPGAGRHRNRATRYEEVGYFSYSYRVGGKLYEGEIRRTGPLVRARVGDSVRVCRNAFTATTVPMYHQLVQVTVFHGISRKLDFPITVCFTLQTIFFFFFPIVKSSDHKDLGCVRRPFTENPTIVSTMQAEIEVSGCKIRQG